LESLAEAAWANGSQVRILLTADDGMGRSELVRQLALRTPKDIHTAVVDCGRESAASGLLRALIGPLEQDRLSWEERLDGSARLASLEIEHRPAARAALLALVGAGTFAATVDRRRRRLEGFAEVARWLSRANERWLLVFDDAHLADEDSVALFQFLGSHEWAMPTVLLISALRGGDEASPAFRERAARWSLDERWERLELSPWRPDEVLELLKERGLGAGAERLATIAGGNPGLAVALSAFGEVPTDALPRTLAAARVESVMKRGGADVEVAQFIAVMGGRIPLECVERLGVGGASHVERLRAAGVLRIDGGGRAMSLVDHRLRWGLLETVSPRQMEQWGKAGASWARERLETLDRASFIEEAAWLLPLASPSLDAASRSVWSELWSLGAMGTSSEPLALTSALNGAEGIRRLVLLRRLAELQLHDGQVEKALDTLKGLPTRVARDATPLQSSARPVQLIRAIEHVVLDRWDQLSSDEALTACELVRAECLSHAAKKDDALAAFGGAERRLQGLNGSASHQLWIRFAASMSWFSCEVLGNPRAALALCERARSRVPPELLERDEAAIGLIRAQEVACSATGNFTQASALSEELLALTRACGNQKEECLAWNARAILWLGHGALSDARRGFERSLQLARVSGWTRREAIASHNLALVLCEQGDSDGAAALENSYARLSALINNHYAKAEAPLVLANAALAKGHFEEAEQGIGQARRLAEGQGWQMVLASARALGARLRLCRYMATRDVMDLTKARSDSLAVLNVLEESSMAWTEELDPGEVFAVYAVVLACSSQVDAARESIERARSKIPKENLVSHRTLDVARAWLDGASLDEPLSFFVDQGWARRAHMWKSFNLDRPAVSGYLRAR
jgi:tetratricopeptide (TPR) repeat protein